MEDPKRDTDANEEDYSSAYRLLWGDDPEGESEADTSFSSAAEVDVLLRQDLEVVGRTAPTPAVPSPSGGEDLPDIALERSDLASVARLYTGEGAPGEDAPAEAAEVTGEAAEVTGEAAVPDQRMDDQAALEALAAQLRQFQPREPATERTPEPQIRKESSAHEVKSALEEAAQKIPDGTLVPRSVWAAVLDQLAHLHESGKEAAVAQERAAKAETKVEFLTERLAETRKERDRLKALLDEFLTTEKELTGGPEPVEDSGTLLDLMAEMAAERDEVRKKLTAPVDEKRPTERRPTERRDEPDRKRRGRKWFRYDDRD